MALPLCYDYLPTRYADRWQEESDCFAVVKDAGGAEHTLPLHKHMFRPFIRRRECEALLDAKDVSALFDGALLPTVLYALKLIYAVDTDDADAIIDLPVSDGDLALLSNATGLLEKLSAQDAAELLLRRVASKATPEQTLRMFIMCPAFFECMGDAWMMEETRDRTYQALVAKAMAGVERRRIGDGDLDFDNNHACQCLFGTAFETHELCFKVGHPDKCACLVGYRVLEVSVHVWYGFATVSIHNVFEFDTSPRPYIVQCALREHKDGPKVPLGVKTATVHPYNDTHVKFVTRMESASYVDVTIVQCT